MQQETYDLKVYPGPTLEFPFKAAVVNLDYRAFFNEEAKPLDEKEFEALGELLSQTPIRQLDHYRLFNNAAELVASLAVAMLKVNLKFLEPRSKVVLNDAAGCLIAIEHEFDFTAIHALRFALELVSHIKKSEGHSNEQWVQRTNSLLKTLKRLQLGPNSTVMLAAAKQLSIPYYRISPMDKLISFGQGKNSLYFFETLSEFDTQTGVLTSHKKDLSNRLLDLMGYPVPAQAVVSNYAAAQRVAEEIGFPVVIKPPASGKGTGVSCNISDHRYLKNAFDLAGRHSDGGVIVEQHVPGDDHRITVLGKTVLSVFRRTPPAVIGDGSSNIQQLIEEENNSRTKEGQDAVSIKGVPIDNELVQLLGTQGLRLASILPVGKKLILRSNANLSTGGTQTDVSELMHPDNIEMAIAVTQALRLDLCGIDFLTTDISRSWKEEGKIIEVNAYPGLSRVRAKLLQDKFDERNNGRIASTLIVSDSDEFIERYVAKRAKANPSLGFTSSGLSHFFGDAPVTNQKSLYERCLSLLLNRRCDEIIVAIGATEVIDQGIPLDHFDQCLVHRDSLTLPELSQAFESGGKCASFLSTFCRDMRFV